MRKPHGVEKRIKNCSEWRKHSRGSGNSQLRRYWKGWLDRVMKGIHKSVDVKDCPVEHGVDCDCFNCTTEEVNEFLEADEYWAEGNLPDSILEVIADLRGRDIESGGEG